MVGVTTETLFLSIDFLRRFLILRALPDGEPSRYELDWLEESRRGVLPQLVTFCSRRSRNGQRRRETSTGERNRKSTCVAGRTA